MDPRGVGIGLRAPHYAELLERRPALAFLEVHSENFFGSGGPALEWLERFRALYPLSLHGVGLSLGSCDPLDTAHLERLRSLVQRFEPALVSEHLSWSSMGGVHANDLLPLPLTEEAARHVAGRIAQVQDRLGRELLVENVSSYVRLQPSAMPEAQFVAEVVRRSGCRLLLDVNNVWVNSVNHGFDPDEYLASIEPSSVAEVHLAGFERGPGFLVDTHAAPVAEEVWSFHARAMSRLGARPTLVEWDADLPPLDVLLAEAERARAVAA
jgi:uncharacterized protein (UPF0276 family)